MLFSLTHWLNLAFYSLKLIVKQYLISLTFLLIAIVFILVFYKVYRVIIDLIVNLLDINNVVIGNRSNNIYKNMDCTKSFIYELYCIVVCFS